MAIEATIATAIGWAIGATVLVLYMHRQFKHVPID